MEYFKWIARGQKYLFMSTLFGTTGKDCHCIVKIDEQLPSLCQVVELNQQATCVNGGFTPPEPYKMIVFVQKPNAKHQFPLK